MILGSPDYSLGSISSYPPISPSFPANEVSFKIGDMVEVLIDNPDGSVFKKGDRYEIIEIDLGSNGCIYYGKVGGGKNWVHAQYLKLVKKEGKPMFKSLKEYFGKHQDTIVTIGLVILVDHFVFGGALREKIKGTVESLLGKAQKKIEEIN